MYDSTIPLVLYALGGGIAITYPSLVAEPRRLIVQHLEPNEELLPVGYFPEQMGTVLVSRGCGLFR